VYRRVLGTSPGKKNDMIGTTRKGGETLQSKRRNFQPLVGFPLEKSQERKMRDNPNGAQDVARWGDYIKAAIASSEKPWSKKKYEGGTAPREIDPQIKNTQPRGKRKHIHLVRGDSFRGDNPEKGEKTRREQGSRNVQTLNQDDFVEPRGERKSITLLGVKKTNECYKSCPFFREGGIGRSQRARDGFAARRDHGGKPLFSYPPGMKKGC